MDFGSANLLKTLFEGQEGLDLTDTLPAGNSGHSFLLQDHPYGCLSNKPGNRPATPHQSLDYDSPEDPLRFWINPNDVYPSRSPSASPESDGGVSETPCRDLPPPDPSSTVVLEVLCDTGTWGDRASLLVSRTPLENWTPLGIHPPTCITSQASLGFLEAMTHINIAEVPTDQLQHPGLFLTDEEKHLLTQEGVLLQDVLHLSQAEERILKKIRRKIRNKQSAQDSRQRKKEYLDRLESQAAACSAQNQDLKKKVQQLEKHKESLLGQLRKLQGLLKQTSSKAAQTSTCLVVLLVSFGLFIWPSCASFFGGSRVGPEDHKPPGVLSRNILTRKEAPELGAPPAARLPEVPPVRTELPPELHATSFGEDEAEENRPVAGEAMLEGAFEAQRGPQTQPKGRWRGKATRPDLDEI